MAADDRSDTTDPVVAAYPKDVDRTLLRSNLRLSAEDRIRKLHDFVWLMATLRRPGVEGAAASTGRRKILAA